MNCNWVRERLSSYVDGMLDERSLETIESHIHECASCRAELELLRKMLATVSDVEDVEPPTALRASIKEAVNSVAREECERVEMLLSEYLDGSLCDADRCLVDKHLAACLDCSYQLAALANTLELARSVEQVEPPANLRERILTAIESLMNRGITRRALGRVGEWLAPAPAKWAAVGIAAAAIAALVTLPQWQTKPVPVAKKPVSAPLHVRERAPQPAPIVAQRPTAAQPAADEASPASRIERPARPRLTVTGRPAPNKMAAAHSPAKKKPLAVAKASEAAAPTELASKPAATEPADIIAEQVKETVAKVNTEIAAEKAKPKPADEKILKIAVARREPTDQLISMPELKEELAKQKKVEQKSSVTIIGTKF